MNALAARDTADARPATARLPFDGLRVLDFCWVGAGAFVTKLLAELGAEVIKIESTARPDNLRLAPPFKPGNGGLEGSGYFASRNSNKKSFALNMSHPEAPQLARRLAAACSVVTSNFRPGVMERWGLSYESLCLENPSLIYLSMPMQGADGPHRSYSGFGSTIAALAGLVHLSGRPDRPPVGTGTHYPDHVPNPGHGLVALLAALYHRQQTGEGQQIELSQLESTVNVLGPAVLEESLGHGPHVRAGNRVAEASPHGVFACRETDAWCAIACRTQDHWLGLIDVLGRREWADADDFATLPARKLHEAALEFMIAAETAGWERQKLVAALRERGVPAAAVSSSRDVLEDADLNSRGYWTRVEHPVIGPMAVAGPPFRIEPLGRPELRRAPLLGEHTEDIAMRLLAMEKEEVERLRREGLLS